MSFFFPADGVQLMNAAVHEQEKMRSLYRWHQHMVVKRDEKKKVIVDTGERKKPLGFQMQRNAIYRTPTSHCGIRYGNFCICISLHISPICVAGVVYQENAFYKFRMNYVVITCYTAWVNIGCRIGLTS